MKYIVISDIHGSSYYAHKIDEIIQKEQPEKIILLGDLYYHGPRNSLTKEYDPIEVSNVLNKYASKILCTRGNCDAEVDEMISDFEFKDTIKIEINGKNFFFTHGHNYNIDNIPENTDVLIYGHFHTGYIKEKKGVLCINSGSIALPREETKNSYLTIDDNKIILKDVEGNKIDEIEYKK